MDNDAYLSSGDHIYVEVCGLFVAEFAAESLNFARRRLRISRCWRLFGSVDAALEIDTNFVYVLARFAALCMLLRGLFERVNHSNGGRSIVEAELEWSGKFHTTARRRNLVAARQGDLRASSIVLFVC